MCDDYNSLPINIGAPSFATRNDCKQFTVMNTIVFLNNGEDFVKEGHRFVKKYMLLCKNTTYSSRECITFNLEWFGKVWQEKNQDFYKMQCIRSE